MLQGPDGFAIAAWQDGQQQTTEIPNLALEKKAAAAPLAKPKAKAKGKAKAKAKGEAKASAKRKESPCKKPASTEDSRASASAADPAAETKSDGRFIPAGSAFRKEYRSSNNSIAFRGLWKDCNGKEMERQIFHLVGLDKISKADLVSLGDECLAKLRAGENITDVQSFAECQLLASSSSS